MNYTFKSIHYNEDDRAQRYLDVFEDLGPGQINVSYVNSTKHVVAWHKHNIQTDYWVWLLVMYLARLPRVWLMPLLNAPSRCTGRYGDDGD